MPDYRRFAMDIKLPIFSYFGNFHNYPYEDDASSHRKGLFRFEFSKTLEVSCFWFMAKKNHNLHR